MSIDMWVPDGSAIEPGFAAQNGSGWLGIGIGRAGQDSTLFGVANDQNGALISAFVPPSSAGGWAVYTFKKSGAFTVSPGAVIDADVLLVGGGGSGGGGYYGGGGGAGGFVDKHDVQIYDHTLGSGGDGLYPDGDIIVGAGGAQVPFTAGHGNQGEDSRLGEGLVAYGGGYGGKVFGLTYPFGGYPASDGASGGGATGTDLPDHIGPTGIRYWSGVWGQAAYNTEAPEGGDARDYEQGHNGGQGGNSSSWYYHSAGGGGGAQWPAYGHGRGMNGGLGRCCGIGGWYQDPRPIWNAIWQEQGWPYLPWFGGGGAGKERSNLWSYPNGDPGFGGGGAVGQAGYPNTGGGGGGTGWFGSTVPPGMITGQAPGPAGGSGIVIVRIPIAHKRFVTEPVIDGEGNWPDGVRYAELPPNQPHIDYPGQEEVTIYGWPTQNEYEQAHFHDWGYSDAQLVVWL